jgi:hypothetical protein
MKGHQLIPTNHYDEIKGKDININMDSALSTCSVMYSHHKITLTYSKAASKSLQLQNFGDMLLSAMREEI